MKIRYTQNTLLRDCLLNMRLLLKSSGTQEDQISWKKSARMSFKEIHKKLSSKYLVSIPHLVSILRTWNSSPFLQKALNYSEFSGYIFILIEESHLFSLHDHISTLSLTKMKQFHYVREVGHLQLTSWFMLTGNIIKINRTKDLLINLNI